VPRDDPLRILLQRTVLGFGATANFGGYPFPDDVGGIAGVLPLRIVHAGRFSFREDHKSRGGGCAGTP
jgi:hypothetical protein